MRGYGGSAGACRTFAVDACDLNREAACAVVKFSNSNHSLKQAVCVRGSATAGFRRFVCTMLAAASAAMQYDTSDEEGEQPSIRCISGLLFLLIPYDLNSWLFVRSNINSCATALS